VSISMAMSMSMSREEVMAALDRIMAHYETLVSQWSLPCSAIQVKSTERERERERGVSHACQHIVFRCCYVNVYSL
jgi:hypothetical protein